MKRIVQFNHLFLMTATLLTIASCGENRNKGGTGTGFSVNQSMVATRDLTTGERTIATRICYAYQSKNTSFKTQTYYGGSFSFKMNSKTCAENSEIYTVVGVLTSASDGSLFYSTNTTKPFSPKVQTSQTGFLSQLCTKIQNNLPISNTAVVDNVTVQVAFTSSDVDSYVLNYFSKQNNVMKITSAETFKVRTQFNQGAGQILGMDEIFTRQNVCSPDPITGAVKFSQFTQTYTSYVPQ